jgi:hypothetical protein
MDFFNIIGELFGWAFGPMGAKLFTLWFALAFALYWLMPLLIAGRGGSVDDLSDEERSASDAIIQETLAKKRKASNQEALLTFRGFAGYQTALVRVLDWLDGALGPRGRRYVRPVHRAFNWHGFDRMLLIALIYPLGVPLVLWALFNLPIYVGDIVFQRASETLGPRIATGLLLINIAFIRPIARLIEPLVARVILAWRARSFFVILVLPAPLGTDASQEALNSARLVASAGAFAFAFAFAFAVARQLIYYALALILWWLLLGAIANRIETAFDRGRGVGGWYLGFLAVVIAILILTPLAAGYFAPEARILHPYFIFLAVFPLINAGFDFLSIGLTRFFLQRSVQGGWAVFWSVLDVILAAILFALLVMALIGALHGLNLLSGGCVFDFEGFFKDVAEGNATVIWAYVMIFSTLLPTLAHAGLAVLTAGFSILGVLRCWGARCYDANLSLSAADKKASLILAPPLALFLVGVGCAVILVFPTLPDLHWEAVRWIGARAYDFALFIGAIQ